MGVRPAPRLLSLLTPLEVSPGYVCAQSLSCVQLLATSWTAAHQAPLSMRLSRQEYWSGLPFSPLGDLFYLGIETSSPASPLSSQADSLLLCHLGSQCLGL